MMQYVYIGLGGAIGAVLRFAIGQWQHNNAIPWHTLLANVLGSLVIGFLFALAQSQKINQQLYLFLAIGICGGFTTFSSFSLENMQFLTQQEFSKFLLYTFLTLGCCLFGTFVGYKFTKLFLA